MDGRRRIGRGAHREPRSMARMQWRWVDDDPRDPLANATLAEMETFAAGLLPTNALDYYASGARDEQTFRGNLAAWGRWWLVPRMLIDVSQVSLATTILGHPIALPIMVAPMASQRMAHPDGELATARAAAGCRHDHGRLDEHDGPDRGDRRRARRQLLVPALPVRRLRADRGDDRTSRSRPAPRPICLTVDVASSIDPKRRPRGGIISPEWVKYPMHPPLADTGAGPRLGVPRATPGQDPRTRSS